MGSLVEKHARQKAQLTGVTEEQQGEACGWSSVSERRVVGSDWGERESVDFVRSWMLGFYSEIGSHGSVLSRRVTSSDIF